jgi:hypothetical protein
MLCTFVYSVHIRDIRLFCTLHDAYESVLCAGPNKKGYKLQPSVHNTRKLYTLQCETDKRGCKTLTNSCVTTKKVNLQRVDLNFEYITE